MFTSSAHDDEDDEGKLCCSFELLPVDNCLLSTLVEDEIDDEVVAVDTVEWRL